jgi:hypothetical protein
MAYAGWQLEGHLARLQGDAFAANVDLARPGDGLLSVRVSGEPVREGSLLALTPPLPASGSLGLPSEHYARGADLVAVYEESASWPIRADVLWRALPPDTAQGVLAAIDLVVSVRTSLLESRPELVVRSRIPAAEVLRRTAAPEAEFETLSLPVAEPLAMTPDRGPRCLLFRGDPGLATYAEMVHPADFQHAALVRASGSAALVCVEDRLFPQALEKGVILRARVRGLFVARRDDARKVAASYAAFAAAEPPLGT